MNPTDHHEPSRRAEALALYRLPVYVLLRRGGHAPPATSALLRGFFAQWQADASRDSNEPQRGLRDALRARLTRYLGASPATPQADSEPDAALEARYLENFAPELDPEACFERALGLELMAAALAELRREARQGGRDELFEALAPWLAQDPPAGQYDVIAQAHRLPPLALHTALRRLRQRFRELVDNAMMHAVSGLADPQARRSALQHSFKPE